MADAVNRHPPRCAIAFCRSVDRRSSAPRESPTPVVRSFQWFLAAPNSRVMFVAYLLPESKSRFALIATNQKYEWHKRLKASHECRPEFLFGRVCPLWPSRDLDRECSPCLCETFLRPGLIPCETEAVSQGRRRNSPDR